MNIDLQASVLGQDEERGGALCKVWCYHDGKMPYDSAVELLTRLKQEMGKKGYEVVRGSSRGSFKEDADGEKVLESSYGGKCLAVLFTHRNEDLPDADLTNDVNASLATIEIAIPPKKHTK